MDREDGPVTRAMFERNLAGKIDDTQLFADISTLLTPAFESRRQPETSGGSRCSVIDAAVAD